jgi:hypothetical protein
MNPLKSCAGNFLSTSPPTRLATVYEHALASGASLQILIAAAVLIRIVAHPISLQSPSSVQIGDFRVELLS